MQTPSSSSSLNTVSFVLKQYFFSFVLKRRVFRCFHSAIFELTRSRFRTFVHDSRTVKSSCMKFGHQQFEINSLLVLKLEATGHVTSILEPENCPKSFEKKPVSFKSDWSTGRAKNISHGFMSWDIFSSLRTHFWRRWSFFVFFSF